MKDTKIITNNLKQMRKERGIKQKFVAEQLGISPNYYSQIENGHRQPQIEHLLKLRCIFSVSLDDIFFNNMIANRDKNYLGGN
ncbi:helix-turn-helix domain-containing protein [Virgibacillus halodenitrificans]|uniref:helix-turn-helix domain-containing protein n=1 Tax=Virgibacillus halodenitrificans TaxID=1482 RepID=UPI000EF5034C|nr:helix-turn-helix transcriptional regulator [Virgibacillus halodenitrificans]